MKSLFPTDPFDMTFSYDADIRLLTMAQIR